MKKKLLLIVLLTLFVLCGCVNQTPAETTSPKETQPQTYPTETAVETTYPEMLECATAEGFVTRESIDNNTPCHIRIAKQRGDHALTGDFSYVLYVEIDTGTAVLKKELESKVSPFPEVSLFLGDVDGDGIQEIFIHDNTGGCGGFGLWRTWILKVEDNEIGILFQNYNEFDTGFESRFLDGYQLEVKNRLTGYCLVFDVKKGHRNYIDDCKELPDGNIDLDPFYVFEPEDTDDDGISEVVCKQYTSIISHVDYTGTACSVLKFNTETLAFEVVNAWYEPYIEK